MTELKPSYGQSTMYTATTVEHPGSLNTSFASSTTNPSESDPSNTSMYEGVAIINGGATISAEPNLLLEPSASGEGKSSPSPPFTAEYLAQLIKDKKQMAAFPGVFVHVERILDDEVKKVRMALFQLSFTGADPSHLPEAVGAVQTMCEKVFVPAKEYPEYNFVGRILGPRGMTAKQLEQETGCKIMVRGRGSMRDKKKEEMNRGKPNWEHLNDELHVLVQCEDTENRARHKLKRAVEEVKKLLVPAPEGEDELKRKQLMELAIINGTYRPANQRGAANNMLADSAAARQLFAQAGIVQSPTMGAPLILGGGVRGQTIQSPYQQALLLAQQQQQLDPTGALAQQQQQQMLFNQMAMADPSAQMAQYAAQQAAYLNTSVLAQQPDYAAQLAELQNSNALLSQQRRYLGQSRDHPYQRVNGST